jgi:hypothetical protein
VVFTKIPLGITIVGRSDGSGCSVCEVREGSGREDLVGRTVQQVGGEDVGKKSEQDLRSLIVTASAGTLPLTMVFGAAPAIAPILNAERAKLERRRRRRKRRRKRRRRTCPHRRTRILRRARNSVGVT